MSSSMPSAEVPHGQQHHHHRQHLQSGLTRGEPQLDDRTFSGDRKGRSGQFGRSHHRSDDVSGGAISPSDEPQVDSYSPVYSDSFESDEDIGGDIDGDGEQISGLNSGGGERRRIVGKPARRTGSDRPGFNNQMYKPRTRYHHGGRGAGRRGDTVGVNGGGGTGIAGAVPTQSMDEVTRQIVAASELKIKDLRSENEDLRRQIDALTGELKTILRQNKLQGRQLDKVTNKEAEVPSLVARYTAELQALQEQGKRNREKLDLTTRQNKELDGELARTRRHLNRLRELAENRQLGERDALARQVSQLQARLEAEETQRLEMEKNLELVNKNHKHELSIEIHRNKDLRKKLRDMEANLRQTEQVLKEKCRVLEIQHIYSQRVPRVGRDAVATLPPMSFPSAGSAGSAGSNGGGGQTRGQRQLSRDRFLEGSEGKSNNRTRDSSLPRQSGQTLESKRAAKQTSNSGQESAVGSPPEKHESGGESSNSATTTTNKKKHPMTMTTTQLATTSGLKTTTMDSQAAELAVWAEVEEIHRQRLSDEKLDMDLSYNGGGSDEEGEGVEGRCDSAVGRLKELERLTYEQRRRESIERRRKDDLLAKLKALDIDGTGDVAEGGEKSLVVAGGRNKKAKEKTGNTKLGHVGKASKVKSSSKTNVTKQKADFPWEISTYSPTLHNDDEDDDDENDDVSSPNLSSDEEELHDQTIPVFKKGAVERPLTPPSPLPKKPLQPASRIPQGHPGLMAARRGSLGSNGSSGLMNLRYPGGVGPPADDYDDDEDVEIEEIKA